MRKYKLVVNDIEEIITLKSTDKYGIFEGYSNIDNYKILETRAAILLYYNNKPVFVSHMNLIANSYNTVFIDSDILDDTVYLYQVFNTHSNLIMRIRKGR